MTLLRFPIVFTLLLSIIRISCNADSNEAEREIEQLKSKIASLESTCLDQEKEIKEKGKRQSDLESNIQENSAQIASLSNEIDFLQRNDNSDDDELISKANAHHYMLQKQIEMLEKEMETQVQKREAFEAKASLGKKLRKYSSYMEPHMQIATSKTSDVYEVCIDTITPHYIKAKQGFESYLHDEIIIAQVKMVTQPYVTKVHLIFEPYKKRVFGPINMNHHKLRTTIYENVKKHELLRPIATETIAWILASALVCVPLIIFYRLSTFIFSKKKKSGQNRGSHHVPHKHKRRHIDK